jgi:hypothetical protein
MPLLGCQRWMSQHYRPLLGRSSSKVLPVVVTNQLLADYQLRLGSGRERATLVKFLQLSYQELFPEQGDFSHLPETLGGTFLEKRLYGGLNQLMQQLMEAHQLSHLR